MALDILAQEAETRIFCYAHEELRREDRDDEILRFIEYWKERTGHWPEELVFDSKLTTYRNLNEFNKRGIDFITPRRRSKKMLSEIV